MYSNSNGEDAENKMEKAIKITEWRHCFKRKDYEK